MKALGIYLLASERSGSNLLRSLLGNHSQVSAPVAPHLLNEFYPIRRAYGDLRKEANGKLLFRDMRQLADHPYHDWGIGEVLEEKVLEEEGAPSSVLHSVALLYAAKAQLEGKTHFASKGIHNVYFIDPIRAELKQASFLHLVRDPRDHVASWMKKPIHLFSPYDAIQKWVQEQEMLLDGVHRKGLDVLSIRYEDLIHDPATVMGRVLEYLGLPIEKECFDTDPEKGKELRWNPHWENLSQPVMSENQGKYKEVLDQEDLEMIETLAKNPMKAFGYEFETKKDWCPTHSYLEKVKRQRAEGKERAKHFGQGGNEKLDSKIRFVQDLKQNRLKEVENEEISLKILNGASSASPSFFQNRFRYLSKAVLGDRLTDRMKVLIKNERS